MNKELKRRIQDTVFCDLFKIPEYQLALFRAIHPELTDVTVDQITYTALNPVFLNQEYNDFSSTTISPWWAGTGSWCWWRPGPAGAGTSCPGS